MAFWQRLVQVSQLLSFEKNQKERKSSVCRLCVKNHWRNTVHVWTKFAALGKANTRSTSNPRPTTTSSPESTSIQTSLKSTGNPSRSCPRLPMSINFTQRPDRVWSHLSLNLPIQLTFENAVVNRGVRSVWTLSVCRVVRMSSHSRLHVWATLGESRDLLIILLA